LAALVVRGLERIEDPGEQEPVEAPPMPGGRARVVRLGGRCGRGTGGPQRSAFAGVLDERQHAPRGESGRAAFGAVHVPQVDSELGEFAFDPVAVLVDQLDERFASPGWAPLA
jgi:hypothetical protein